MQWMRSLMGMANNRRTIMSLLALGAAGATAVSLTRRRRNNGNAWRQMMQPIRKMF
ncbi:hypothetical protein [Paenibacillus senegalensis]|uniref:hypothetical protein n=1 Tax=Paenibacillus senegalensis TaxID=1465766 RepID=UPI0002E4EE5B|nr:hypothetical protein [Paenibacillus senegalensis]